MKQYPNCIYLARSRFVAYILSIHVRPRVSHILVHRYACRIEKFRGSVKAEERETAERTERASRGCGPNYPQWLSRMRKRDMSLGGRKDGNIGIFLLFLFLGVPTILHARTCRIDSPRLVYKLFCEWHFANCCALSRLFANSRRRHTKCTLLYSMIFLNRSLREGRKFLEVEIMT